MIPRQLYLLFVLAVIFPACRSNNTAIPLSLLNKTLVQTKEMLEKENSVMVEGIIGGEKNPYWTIEHYWGPVTDSIVKLGKDALTYLEMVKSQKTPGTGAMQEIFKRLYTYRQRLFDSALVEKIGRSDYLRNEILAIKKKMPLLQGYDGLAGDRLDAAAREWADSNVDMREPQLMTVTLNRLENEVLLSERSLLLFCNDIARTIHTYEEAHLITQLSSNCVRSGESIEITAGIGLFTYRMEPHFFIDGKEIKPDDRPFLVHRIKATGQPGKHMIAFRVSYYRPDGSQIWMDKNLEYTIAN